MPRARAPRRGGGALGPQPTLLAEIQRFRRRLVRTLGRVDHVILFGSQARGDAAADSDVDLVVVSPGFEGLSFIDRSV
ncbi:MAG TPA: nucleotidyltransferase domain-containing protein, partial [Candidatus Thermoplasmatota archaeon]|nr:nucleotidyltransferase domain-containing protein [Candidatus Thermoplasmatota archaeon]